MSRKHSSTHRYEVRFQGLFDGIEWTIFEDGKSIRVGYSPSLSSALLAVRRTFHAIRRESLRDVSYCHAGYRNRRFSSPRLVPVM